MDDNDIAYSGPPLFQPDYSEEHYADLEMDPNYVTSPWNHPIVSRDDIGEVIPVFNRAVSTGLPDAKRASITKKHVEEYDLIRRVLEKEQGYLLEDMIELDVRLNPLQRRFILEYSRCFSATKAAEAIFGKGKYPNAYYASMGSRLMADPVVRSEIDRVSADAMSHLDINSMQVLLQVARIAFGDIGDYVTWDDDGAHPRSLEELQAAGIDTAPIEKVVFRSNKNGNTFELKMYNKVEALGMLAKIFKMVPEQVEVSGKDGKPIAYVNASESLISKLADLAQREGEARSTVTAIGSGASRTGEGLEILGSGQSDSPDA